MIKSQIAGVSAERAKEILHTYTEIEDADVKISPRRYSTTTSIKSRIFVKIK